MKACKCAGVVIVLLLLVSTSQANILIISQTNWVDHHVPTHNKALSFNQYDGELPLETIEIIFKIWMYDGSIEWDNDSDEAGEVWGTLGVRASLTSTDVTLSDGTHNPWTNIFNTISGDFEIGPTSGDPVGQFDRTYEEDYVLFPGPDSNTPRLVTISAYIHEDYLADFIGNGTYNLNYSASQHSMQGSDTGTYSETSPSHALSSVEVIYTAIPEPTTMVLFGVSGLAILWWRRRMHSAS